MTIASGADPEEAAVWIEDLAKRNRAYYEDRLGTYRKQARDVIALGGLEHCSLAVGRKRGRDCLVVPLWTDRAPAAYRPLIEAALAAAVEPPDLSPNGTGA